MEIMLFWRWNKRKTLCFYGTQNQFIYFFQRPKTGDALCKQCFFIAFENEIHNTIAENNLFKSGDRVAVAASGGKDSTVLAYVLKLLNERHNYGLKLVLLSIDEGITGRCSDIWI